MAKTTQKQLKSPSISRKISEYAILKQMRRDWTVFIFSFIAGILLMVILFVAFDSVQLIDELEMKHQERLSLQDEIIDWEHVVSKYPDYRDAYFKLALLYYQTGNREKASEDLSKVFFIDPEFSQGNILRGKLEEKK